MATIQTRRCVCTRRYEILVDARRGDSALDRADIDDLSCPDCGSLEPTVQFGAASTVKGYPYFDTELGLEIQSPGHRARVLKERGLVALDGELANVLERQHAEQRRQQEDHDRQWAEHEAMCEADPDVRRMRDRFAEIAATTRDPDEVRRAFYGR